MAGKLGSIARASNRLLWRPELSSPHIESLFFKFNLIDERQALWFQFGARNLHRDVGAPHAHVMAALFDAARPENNRAVKQRFPASATSTVDERLALQFGECVLEEGFTTGRVLRGGHRFEWELRSEAATSDLQHYCYDRLYDLPFPKTKATTPVLDTRFSGWVEVDGERITVDRAPGMQGHNWGVEYAHRWAWTHSNTLQGKHGPAVFEALTGQVRFGRFTSPWIGTAVLDYDGKRLRFDTLRNPQALQSRPGQSVWHLEAHGRHHRLTAHVEAPPAHFIGVNYRNPDGRVVHCYNSSVASAEIRIWKRKGLRWAQDDVLRCTHGAALELAGPARPPELKIYVS